jgi:hypothetical protein
VVVAFCVTVLLSGAFVFRPGLVPTEEIISTRIDEFQSLLLKVMLFCFLVFGVLRLLCNELAHLLSDLEEWRRR